MRLPRQDMFDRLEPLLPLVEKPSRYTDHEWGSTLKDGAGFHVCLVYPDTYEVGQSNLGLAILSNVLNGVGGISCERGYLPWVDMADLMRSHGVPLLSLESASPLASFDVIGFSIAHELVFTNICEVLDLSGIAMLSSERDEDDPVIIGGGPSVFNPEPVAEMFDAILLGDGEEAIIEMVEAVRSGRSAGLCRAEILSSLARIDGVYVPSLYDVVVDDSSTIWGHAVPKAGSGAPEVVVKRVVSDLAATDPLPQKVVPYGHIVFDRLAVEILRGCARGCRFCQAGMTYRPVRERPVDQVVSACARGLADTGYDEVSLTSLSTTDHSGCEEMLRRVNASLEGSGASVSIPSQRLDAFGVDMAQAASSGARGGLTFAPEAGTQRLRDVINKNVSESDIEGAVRNAFVSGWRRMKLYFMMGLPTETDADVAAIPDVASTVLRIGRETLPRGAQGGLSVSLSVAVFVPKAWTPFQWQGQLPLADVRRRQRLLVDSTKSKAVRVSYHDAWTSLLEGTLSRSGRGALALVIAAWRHGCRFDAWTEQFDFSRWEQAAGELGMDLSSMATKGYRVEDKLPWDHLSPGVSKDYLLREWRRAAQGVTTQDCTMTSCTGCGVCQTLGVSNVLEGDR